MFACREGPHRPHPQPVPKLSRGDLERRRAMFLAGKRLLRTTPCVITHTRSSRCDRFYTKRLPDPQTGSSSSSLSARFRKARPNEAYLGGLQYEMCYGNVVLACLWLVRVLKLSQWHSERIALSEYAAPPQTPGLTYDEIRTRVL